MRGGSFNRRAGRSFCGVVNPYRWVFGFVSIGMLVDFYGVFFECKH